MRLIFTTFIPGDEKNRNRESPEIPDVQLHI